ncbi:MAG TPA: hypothetical protein PKW35_25615, partial [Nannocystaceae bacterium]|nr:hypothetical protein [Nannocystaceae bacterium]
TSSPTAPSTPTESGTPGPLTGTTGDPPPCGGCPPNFKCKYDTCIPDLGTCNTNDDCPGDSYCDADGECIPYGVPPDKINDPECVKQDVPEGVMPAIQCEWTGIADPNDKTKGSTLIYTTPIIADLNLDKDPDKLQPSIIVNTFEQIGGLGRIGTLRVFDGRTCTEQLRAGGADDPTDADRPAYAVPWAIADLDDDLAEGGHPELVGYHRMSANNDTALVSLYAFRVVWNGDTPDLERIWYGRDCGTETVLTFSNQNILNGPMIYDLDDDDFPEIIVGENVFDHDGCLLTKWDAAQANQMPAIADVDLDGTLDLVSQRRFATWDIGTTEWIDKPGFVPDAGNYSYVHIGAADFGLNSANAPETGLGPRPRGSLPTLPTLPTLCQSRVARRDRRGSPRRARGRPAACAGSPRWSAAARDGRRPGPRTRSPRAGRGASAPCGAAGGARSWAGPRAPGAR